MCHCLWLNNGSSCGTRCCTRGPRLQLSQENGMVSMATIRNPSCSHVDSRKFCIHLRRFNVRRFWTVEHNEVTDYGTEVAFSDMTSVLNFMKTYELVQKLLLGDTDRRKAWWSHTLHFHFPFFFFSNVEKDEIWKMRKLKQQGRRRERIRNSLFGAE